MNGLLIDTCTNLEFDGVLGTGELEDSAFSAPTGGEQVANVVITGASSGIVFNDFIVGPGAGELFCCIEAEGRKRFAPRTLVSSAASRLQSLNRSKYRTFDDSNKSKYRPFDFSKYRTLAPLLYPLGAPCIFVIRHRHTADKPKFRRPAYRLWLNIVPV